MMKHLQNTLVVLLALTITLAVNQSQDPPLVELPSPAVNAQQVKVIEKKTVTEKPEKKLETVPSKDEWNPNNCDLAGDEIMYKDKSCHPRPAEKVSTPILAPTGDCETSIRKIFEASEVNLAIEIMMYESSGNPAAHNYDPATKDDSYGCFQVNLWGNLASARPSKEWLVQPDNNVQYAYDLFKKVGWCSTQGWQNSAIKAGVCSF